MFHLLRAALVNKLALEDDLVLGLAQDGDVLRMSEAVSIVWRRE